ncbi:MAG TPA: YcbK family protein [Geminicoccus sp.]|uniref:YcbK family protein n=1 Tax=Geminicoccus sp. TaxID=2024832 RepID=UPI002C0D016A|nr:YcbK family protein [Geminicoccus sp.]HWL70677.1 YcbK family protein [Geminicoccus sp.]
MLDTAPRAKLTRRSWLGVCLAAPIVAATTSLPAPALARSKAKGIERVLSFHHQNTGESLTVAYKADGRLIPENLLRIDHLLRDWRSNEVKHIDPDLLDLLWDLQRKLEVEERISVLSGYRTPATNAMLRRRRRGVASNSFHMKGQAIDLRIAGRSTKQIRNAAVALNRGGVGFYPTSGFVHVDTGAPRTWRGV